MKRSRKEWDLILDELENYEGTLEEFIKLKGISRSSLYKNRKLRNMNSKNNNSTPKIAFAKIEMKKERTEEIPIKENIKKADTNKIGVKTKKDSIVKIKIGKAKIILDSTDKSTLSFIMKELSLIC